MLKFSDWNKALHEFGRVLIPEGAILRWTDGQISAHLSISPRREQRQNQAERKSMDHLLGGVEIGEELHITGFES